MDHLHSINWVFKKKERSKQKHLKPLAHSANEVKPVLFTCPEEDLLKHSCQLTLLSLQDPTFPWKERVVSEALGKNAIRESQF